MTVSNDLFQDKAKTLAERELTLKDDLKLTKAKLKEAELMIDKLMMEKRSEGTLMLEVEHYKADNDRLIKLLRDNGRTRDLGEFLQDNKGGVRYLAGKKTHGKKELQNEENENWIPHEAYEIAHKYRTERPEGMSKVEIDKMM